MEASQDSKTLLIKEFLELTDVEETFLEEEPNPGKIPGGYIQMFSP